MCFFLSECLISLIINCWLGPLGWDTVVADGADGRRAASDCSAVEVRVSEPLFTWQQLVSVPPIEEIGENATILRSIERTSFSSGRKHDKTKSVRLTTCRDLGLPTAAMVGASILAYTVIQQETDRVKVAAFISPERLPWRCSVSIDARLHCSFLANRGVFCLDWLIFRLVLNNKLP